MMKFGGVTGVGVRFGDEEVGTEDPRSAGTEVSEGTSEGLIVLEGPAENGDPSAQRRTAGVEWNSRRTWWEASTVSMMPKA